MTYADTTDEDGITAFAYDCGLGNEPAEFPAAVNGNIAIVKRDRVVYFSEKTTNAQNAGAVAEIIYNNTTEEEPDNTVNFRGTLGAPGSWVPVVSLSNIDGESIIGGGLPRPVTVVNVPADVASSLLGLMVVSGVTPEIPVSCISCGVDVNGDGKIGLEEVNYVMRKVAGR